MNKWIKYLLIVFEVGGGFAGITIITMQFNASMPAYIWVIYFFVGFLYLLGIFAGLALIDRPRLGMAFSAIYQALQIPVLSSPLLSYNLLSGLQLGVGWTKNQPAFLVGFGSRCTFFFFQDLQPWLIGVNLVALALFVYLLLQLLPKAKNVTFGRGMNVGSDADKKINPMEIESAEDEFSQKQENR